MKSVSSTIVRFLKIAFALTIIALMVRTGKLNPLSVLRALERWPTLALVAVLVYTQLALTAWRWNLLLEAQALALPFREAFRLTMIGTLFNLAIPTSVGGDVVKGYYLSRKTREKRPEAVTTIVLDRIIGLVGLVMLAGLAGVWNLYQVAGSRALKSLCIVALAAAVAGASMLVGAVAAGKNAAQASSSRRVVAWLLQSAGSLTQYRRKPAVIPGALAISILSHLLACSAIYLAARALGSPHIAPQLFLLIVSLGLVSGALPISPAGIGVGQAAFFALFQLVPHTDPSLGADAFTFYQSVYIAVYLTGLYFYLSYKQVPASQVSMRATSL